MHVFVIAEHKIKTKQKIKNKRRGFVKTIKQVLQSLWWKYRERERERERYCDGERGYEWGPIWEAGGSVCDNVREAGLREKKWGVRESEKGG